MDIIKHWAKAKKPDLSKTDKALWKDFQHWAASNRWDVTIPRQWVTQPQFVAFLGSIRSPEPTA